MLVNLKKLKTKPFVLLRTKQKDLKALMESNHPHTRRWWFTTPPCCVDQKGFFTQVQMNGSKKILHHS